MFEIIPAILTNNPKEFEEKTQALGGLVNRVQIDIVDGVFADNKTVSLEAVASVIKDLETNISFDVHLMTKDPVDWVERAAGAMAERIIGQIEMMSSQVEFIGKVTETGEKVGLALDLPTPVSALDPAVLNNLDVVLVMSVKAGFGGQEFDEGAVEKIKQLDEIRVRDDTPFKICVDGGINEENIAKVRQAGADEVAIGHSLLGEDIGERLETLRKAAYKDGN